MHKTKSGFTIVELLIVIVVIAILAAISIVAYNGIQERARVSTAKSDLSSLGKQVGIFMVDDGAPPDTSLEWGTILKAANLFNGTRDSTVKRFIFCTDATSYAVVQGVPLNYSVNGQPFYFIKNGALGQANWDSSITGTYGTDRACKQPAVLPTYTGSSYSDQAT